MPAAAGYRPANLFSKLLEFQKDYVVSWIGSPFHSRIDTPQHLDAISRQGNLLVERFEF